MIAWLSEWLKEIVVIVLLAVFVDLVLPNHAMQRYVKVVLSLLILLAILSPLVDLLRSGKDWDTWIRSESMGKSDDNPASEVRDMPSLQAISKEAEQMTEERNRQAYELLRERLEAAVTRALEEEIPASRAEASADIEPGGDAGDVMLKQLSIRLWVNGQPKEAMAAAVPLADRKSVSIKPIEPVAPVDVSIHIGDRAQPDDTQPQQRMPGGTDEEAAQADKDVPQAEGAAIQSRALSLIEEQFGIPPSRVKISVVARR